MNCARLREITERIARLRIAVIGDFCLDRYMIIDGEHVETSIETGLLVHNVVEVRSQPGAAGTVLNNLLALGVQELYPIGFCGEDGEGYELLRSLQRLRGVHMERFISTPLRRTFTYCKPLVTRPGELPRELNRLDSKNSTPTPAAVSRLIRDGIAALGGRVDAVVVMDQVDVPETGALTRDVLPDLATFPSTVPVVADCRRTLRDFPPLIFKMNAVELAAMTGATQALELDEIKRRAANIAARNQRPAVITMAEKGIVGAAPGGEIHHVPALPLRGPIDVVGAGDSVTACLASSLAAGASLYEAIEIAALASSLVIHQLGTTGAATPAELFALNDAQGKRQ